MVRTDTDISYKPIIQDFVWSYSRISSFKSCKWQFYLKYIREWTERGQFFASYGSLMHSLIERYYTGELTQSEMVDEFLCNYQTQVSGDKPKNVSSASYVEKGLEYLRAFKPFPYEMLEVEKTIYFNVGDREFVGIVDYLGTDKDGNLYIVDNKSRDLKPRSNRKKPTKNDEILDEMLKQLYLYSIAIRQEYGKYPKALCFNCFKNRQFIVEPFDEEKLKEVRKWVLDTISEIEENEVWDDDEFDFYRCNYLCGFHDRCEIYNEE